MAENPTTVAERLYALCAAQNAAIRAYRNGVCRVLNKRTAPSSGGVYIGRPTKWGNPFQIGKHGTRTEVIAKYRAWVCDQPELMTALQELRGQNLVCWCAPMPCHGDVLLELANGR